MGASPEANKLRLIERIIQSEDPEKVAHLLGIWDNHSAHPAQVESLVRPIREKLVIEDLIKEQNWTPIDKEKLMATIEELDIQESVEELLEMLKE